MSRIPLPPPRPVTTGFPVSWPTWVDYLFILCGCGVSQFLTLLCEGRGLHVSLPREESPSLLVQPLITMLPFLLLLPVGIVLFWPVFHATQRLRGRPSGLTFGEWLWGVAWLLAVVLTTWIVWHYAGSPPEILVSDSFKRHLIVGYALAVLSLGLIALLLTLIDLVGRWPQPWTHGFGLVLLIWPNLPLAAVWAWDIRVGFQSM